MFLTLVFHPTSGGGVDSSLPSALVGSKVAGQSARLTRKWIIESERSAQAQEMLFNSSCLLCQQAAIVMSFCDETLME